MIRIAEPELMILLVILPLLAVFFWYASQMKQQALRRFGNMELLLQLMASTSTKRQILKKTLLFTGIACILLAFLRPQFGTRLEEVKREGQDIIIALDVSASMYAEDIKPNRLEKAKHEIEGIIDRLEGDRIGLVAFAGVSFVQCPLTLDYSAAKIFLDIMDRNLIPVPGTAITSAIRTAIGAFNQEERKHKVLILITDGEDHEGEPVEMAKEAARQGIVIYTVGIGSREGVPIPELGSNNAATGYKKNQQGEVVISKLDEITLEKIALETNGKYYRATPGEEELDRIYESISGMEDKEQGVLEFTQFEEQFQWLVLGALLCMLLEYVLPERRTLKKEWHGRFED